MSKPNPVQLFFWGCAGSTISILKRQETEYAKHTVLGMAVFLTSLLALLTGASAFFICFDNPGLSIVAGIGWAIIIFNIDRSFIINSSSQSDEGKLIFLFLTRFFMAGLISLSLSTIIELKLFEKEIKEEAKIVFVQESKIITTAEIAEAERSITQINKEIKNTQSDNERTEGERNRYRTLASNVAGRDKRELREEAQKKNVLLDTFSTNLNSQLAQKKALSERLSNLYTDNTIDKIKGKYDSKNSGLIEKYNALKSIVEKRKLHELTIFFTLIIAMVEMSPLLLKTMYPRGNYEDMIAKKSDEDKNKYLKELEFDKDTFIKIVEATKGRLNLDKNFVDSKLNPLILLLSKDLASSCEDNLRLNPDGRKSKEFLFYTDEEKENIGKQASQQTNKGIFSQIHDRIDEIGKRFDEIDDKEKNKLKLVGGGFFAGLIAYFNHIGLFAQSFQALSATYKEIIPFFYK
jgi:Domain of unknown function (DUF4407)